MRSFFTIFLLLTTVLFGKETIEVFASEVQSTKDFFEAKGDVVLLYDGALLKAGRATYDKNSSELILYGGVEMIREDETKLSSETLHIDTSSKAVDFKDLLLTTEQDLWISAKEAIKEKEDYKILNSVLSSCDKKNPDWTIEFAEAHYRKEKEFMTLSDAKLSFYDTPIFYFPYMAFPTINKRTSGLLFPQFRISDIEGFVYEQPLFYVAKHNVDIELNPQIRTNRGFGTHLTTRFVDSNHSKGTFRTGYFRNNNSYATKNDLNQEHYGFEFLYSSTDILPKSEFLDSYQSGLFINSTYLNGLEYLNLQKETASGLISSNLIESRVNAFAYDDNDYFGLYAKYYIDISKEDNQETIQELPTLHYHRFMNYLFSDKLFYTFDARIHNYTRVRGSRAHQTQFDLPITYYDSFFNDYLDLTLSENLYLSDVFFSNLNQSSENYRYYRNYHRLELSSDLVKAYGENTHTLHPSFVYTKPSFENETPVEYTNLNDEQQELFVTQTEKENISLGLSQYYYNKALEMNLFHRLAFVKFSEETLNKGDINNEFGYSVENLNLYSNLFYSLDKSAIHSLTSSLAYNQSNYDIMLTHFYNNDFLLNNEKTSFINAKFIQNYNKHNQWFSSADYDLSQQFSHQWNVGWTHKQKCWGATVSIGQEQIPNVDSSFTNNMIYFELNLNPLGGISKSVEQEFSSQGS
ncbi:MAG: Outer membrane protein Imp, required for envelope biogenesis / Organic solvent tolerance protein [uncultured Sulfurovum sp.]|uniref:Outer membrane protein Imp, required for envelope biogenesis / Organic solvent tolerance protein n=1 Tax=uncultured Sulfurovum sp. TaxID=269237 RepID=A0A6S6SK29_9BACT|nr:MAG: Outer membrane protein Imp, required for envelope biogenesis / Organic solvent tolerance protein [uncultured Sulfurovum sp.]